MNTAIAQAINAPKPTLAASASLQSQPRAINVGNNLLSLEQRRKQWEATAYRSSNKALYDILADCLAYSGEISPASAQSRTKELSTFLAERGYVVRKSSPLISRVIRAVFGNVSSSRVSTYSTVLRRARSEGISPKKLGDWIRDNGGIQEVRLAKSPNHVPQSKRIEQAQMQFSSQPVLATVKSESLSMLADANFIGQECVLVATQLPDGSFAIKALVRGTPVKAAFNQLHRTYKENASTAFSQMNCATTLSDTTQICKERPQLKNGDSSNV